MQSWYKYSCSVKPSDTPSSKRTLTRFISETNRVPALGYVVSYWKGAVAKLCWLVVTQIELSWCPQTTGLVKLEELLAKQLKRKKTKTQPLSIFLPLLLSLAVGGFGSEKWPYLRKKTATVKVSAISSHIYKPFRGHSNYAKSVLFFSQTSCPAWNTKCSKIFITSSSLRHMLVAASCDGITRDINLLHWS